MITRYIGYSMLVVLITILSSCKTESTVSSFYNSTIECLGAGHDGSQTLRVWGTGKNKAKAIEEAKKNAVYEVIFNGIRSNMKNCSLRPLVTEVNARERHEAYFNRFFSAKGAYDNYVNTSNEKRDSKIEDTNLSQAKFGIVVTVLSADLKQKLINDGIIKQ